ncbi:MAG: DNA translocase FtsK [Clostridiales Family XIII bacterium]|jgi:S-DNA-T family DNA segregation ATPase FtsK/SpoIIIE|nr:DNA translocase FtsK [Clostridiales Family XIII bacterium]
MTEKKQTKTKPAARRAAGRKNGTEERKGRRGPSTERPVRLRDEIWAIALTAVGVFLIAALQTNAAGQFGEAMKTLLKGCFGFMGYVLPYYMIVYGALLFAKKAARPGGRSLFFCALIFLLLTVINASRYIGEDAGFGVSALRQIFDRGAAGAGGGFFGELIGLGLIKLIGKPGLYILCGTGLLISLLLVINTPISQMFDRLKAKRAERKALASARAADAASAADTAEKTAPAEELRPEESAAAAPPVSILSGKAGTALKQTRIVDYINTEYSDDKAVGTGIEPLSKPAPGMGLEPDEAAPSVSAAPEAVCASDLAAAGEEAAPAPPRAEADCFSALSTLFDGDSDRGNAGQTPEQPAEELSHRAGGPFVPPAYELPHTGLLKSGPARRGKEGGSDPRLMAQKLEQTLRNFDVDAKVIQVTVGPAVTRYEIQPGVGVKVASIKRIENDIALNLEARSLRIEAPIPGKAAVGIEVANDRIDVVVLRDILESREFRNAESKIGFAVGMDISGNSIVADLKSMPHMLIAGSTGSGKSVCINSIIMSLLFKARPDEVRLILIDPKVVELGNYNGIPHLLVPVVTESGKAAAALNWAVTEMNDRYEKLGEERVRDLESYNKRVRERGEDEAALPQIVIIIDELADLMMEARAKVEEAICRIAQKARAAGMHLIVATQRPSVDVITGLIKSNIPSRIAFAVSQQVDSRTILDMSGAEHLMGRGDMLFKDQGRDKPIRVQGAFVSDSEVHAVIEFVKKQMGPEYADDVIQTIETGGVNALPDEENDDDLLPEAVETVVLAKQASASMLQRRFRVGYNRAARLIEMMEARGIVGPADGSRPRTVLLGEEELYAARDGLTEADESL